MKEEFHSFILENIKFYNFLPNNVVINDYVDKLLKLIDETIEVPIS